MTKNNLILKICQKCKARCCKMGGPDFTKKEMQEVLDSGFKNHFVKIGKNHYELKSKKGICPYLARNYSCLIHKVRPLMCKCWPVCVDLVEGKKKLYLAHCHLTPLISKKEMGVMKKQALKIPKTTLVETFTKCKLPKKDVDLIRKRLNSFKKTELK